MGILGDAGRVVRDTIRAFQSELDRREPEDAVAELLVRMKREMVAARERLHAEREALAELQARLSREERALQDCRRRAELAARIEDGETERVAREWEGRHAAEVERLRRDIVELELDIRAGEEESAASVEAYREAERQRFSLVAALRTATPEERPGADEDPFDWLRARIARGEPSEDRARREMRELEERDRAQGVDARLEALKRQMGKG